MDKNGDWMGTECTCAQLYFRKVQQGEGVWNIAEMWDLEGCLAHSKCSAPGVMSVRKIESKQPLEWVQC